MLQLNVPSSIPVSIRYCVRRSHLNWRYVCFKTKLIDGVMI